MSPGNNADVKQLNWNLSIFLKLLNTARFQFLHQWKVKKYTFKCNV